MFGLFNKKKKEEEKKKKQTAIGLSSGYSSNNNNTTNDLTNPLNPLSPFWIGHNVDDSPVQSDKHYTEPVNEHHYTPDPTPDYSPSPSHHNDSTSYDSGSSSYDSGSSGGDSGGGGSSD